MDVTYLIFKHIPSVKYNFSLLIHWTSSANDPPSCIYRRTSHKMFLSCSYFIPLDVHHIFFQYKYFIPTYYEILSHIKMMFDNKSKYLPFSLFFTSFISTGELDKKTGKCCSFFHAQFFFPYFQENIDGKKLYFHPSFVLFSFFYCRHRIFTYSAPAYPRTHQMKDFRWDMRWKWMKGHLIYHIIQTPSWFVCLIHYFS